MKLVEIKNWSDERLITQQKPSREGFSAMIVEELKEKMDAQNAADIYGEVDAICDVSVFAIGEIYKYGFDAEKLLGEGHIMDWLIETTNDFSRLPMRYSGAITYLLGEFLEQDEAKNKADILAEMVVLSYRKLIQIGYDPDKCMNEVMKELNSRTGEYSEETQKWQKFKTPEAMALWYTADFNFCNL